MTDYDAIVIGAGHNGLTAAAIMARGGLWVLCLEKNQYVGGMASTTELMKGYKFEIGLPKIVTGRNYITAQNKSVPCIVISFTSELGKFCLEVSLKKSI